jgi:hypothetical protein
VPKRESYRNANKRRFQDVPVAGHLSEEGNAKLADVNPRTLSGIPVLGSCSDIPSELRQIFIGSARREAARVKVRVARALSIKS